MAAQCCHHPERLLLRRKTLVQTSAIPHTSEDHKLFKQIRFMHQDTSQSTQTTQRGTDIFWMGRDHWVTDICHNQRTLTLWNWKGCCHVVSDGAQSVSSFQCHLYCIVGKTKDFPDLKINANSYFQPISKRKESRTCVLFGKSGLGAIHLYLLFMPLFCVPVITLGIFQTNVTSMWQKWIVETGQTITVTCQIDSCLYSL